MFKTEINCKTTAPLFMAGADSNLPEIRAAGIKGVMRYIWRAAQCATNLSDLRLREGKLFGNADGNNTHASPWRLQVVSFVSNNNISDNALLPYRAGSEHAGKSHFSYHAGGERGGKLFTPSINAGAAFTVRIIGGEDEKQHKSIVKLYILTCALSGFGRRSRKGMGTVEIEEINGTGANIDKSGDLTNIADLLNDVADKKIYTVNADCIACSARGEGYPYIEKVILLPNKKYTPAELQKKIGFAAHENKLNNPNDRFLGVGGGKRFASSLLLSTVKGRDGAYNCIVTQLFCVKEQKPVNRAAFINALRKEVTT